jgi:hypothetical protein
MLIEGPTNSRDYATYRLSESWQLQYRDLPPQTNIRRASRTLTSNGRLSYPYANPYHLAGGQHHLGDLRHGPPPPISEILHLRQYFGIIHP